MRVKGLTAVGVDAYTCTVQRGRKECQESRHTGWHTPVCQNFVKRFSLPKYSQYLYTYVYTLYNCTHTYVSYVLLLWRFLPRT